jgi:hypothetical protein
MFRSQSYAHASSYVAIAQVRWLTPDDGRRTVTETCWVLIFNYVSQIFLTCEVLNVNCDSV